MVRNKMWPCTIQMITAKFRYRFSRGLNYDFLYVRVVYFMGVLN